MRTLIRRLHRDERGMTTAEYAVGTVAAVAFATILYKVVTSGAVLHALTKIVTTALQVHL
jgi:Flp pilus assembly pilin Flp